MANTMEIWRGVRAAICRWDWNELVHCKAPPSDKIRRIRKNEKREREKEFNTKKRRALTIRRAVHISVCTAQHQTAAQQQPKRINVYMGKGGKKEINYMALCICAVQVYQLNKIGSSYLTSGITADRNISWIGLHPAATGPGLAGYSATEKKEEKPTQDGLAFLNRS